MTAATWLVILVQGYAALGVLFAIPFVLVGAKRVDPSAVHGSLGFRVLIFPGVCAFWPWLLVAWLRAGEEVGS